jgi:UDP-N-acetylmuramate dehydrogenase
VGGTPIQNVGAYGQEVSDVITRVRVYDRQARVVREMTTKECEFGYRTSLFNTVGRDRYVVFAVEYGLKRNRRPTIDYPDLKDFFKACATVPSLSEVRNAVRTIRATKAMLLTDGDPDSKSAGSFFKNPVVGPAGLDELVDRARRQGALSMEQGIPHYPRGDGMTKIPAAWLIEASGYLRGTREGPVGLSTKHALAVVNKGGATARDVLGFAGDIQARVEDRFGIRLVVEPRFVGFTDEVVSRFGAVSA